jgi:hypothetical protein
MHEDSEIRELKKTMKTVETGVGEIKTSVASIETSLGYFPEIFVKKEDLTQRIGKVQEGIAAAIHGHARACTAKTMSSKQIIALCTGLAAIVAALSGLMQVIL